MAEKRLTKSEFLVAIAEKSALSKKQAGTVMDAISAVITEQLKASGEVTLPGLLKLTVSTKPATEARPGINPFTKEPTTIAAKPARKVVKARPVKALKDAV